MRIHAMFGREPSHVAQFGYDCARDSFYAEVSVLRLHGRTDFVAAKGLEERIEHVSDLADFLAPYADLDAIRIRALERDRRMSRAAAALSR